MPDDTRLPPTVFEILQKADLARRVLEAEAVRAEDAAEQTQVDEGRPAPHPDHERLLQMEETILRRLNGLGDIGVDNWISRSHPVASEIRAWLRLYEHLFPNEEQEAYERMLLYQQALQQGITCVRKIEMRKELIKDEIQFIRNAHSQVEGADLNTLLANLPEVASTLAMLQVRIRRRHDQMLMLDELTPQADIFTTILEWTGGILSQIMDAEKELGDTQLELELERIELAARKQMGTLAAQIQVAQSSLVSKMIPANWLTEAGRLEGLISDWLELNERLHEPEDEAVHMATLMLTTEEHEHVHKAGACCDRFAALRNALQELPPDQDDISKIQRLQARLASIENTIGNLLSHLSVAIRGYTGPNLFQGLRSWLSALDNSFPIFWTMLDKKKREARRRIQERWDSLQCRIYLNNEYFRIRKRFGDALCVESAPREWMWLRSHLESDLREWLSTADNHTFDPPLADLEEVRRLIPLLQAASTIFPGIQSARNEYERRRTIEFADTNLAESSSDPEEFIQLRSILRWLHVWMSTLSQRLHVLQSRDPIFEERWRIFDATRHELAIMLAELDDFQDRLWRIHAEQEGASPDARTTSEGGGLNLTPRQETAARFLMDRYIETHLKELNEERRRRSIGALDQDVFAAMAASDNPMMRATAEMLQEHQQDQEEELTRDDLSEQVIAQFWQLARRMVTFGGDRAGQFKRAGGRGGSGSKLMTGLDQ